MIIILSIIIVAGSILATIIGTVEYFTAKKITKSKVIEYKSTLKISAIMFIIGIIGIIIYTHINGMLQLIGW